MYLTKPLFREECLLKIKHSPKNNKMYRDSKLNLNLLKELGNIKGKKILFYYPLPFEGDIRKALNKLRKNNTVYIPFMQRQSFKIVPYRLPLKKKKFGIFEAGDTLRDINKIDIAIVPAVGVDGNLQRVGFGKGMYDRFFQKLKKKPYTIFIQSQFCYTKEFVCDDYDISCDLLLTPQKSLRVK